jgi:hypothetical protein
MQANSRVAPAFREIPTTSLSGQVTWFDDGIDVSVAEQVIAQRCAEFKPTTRNRQVHSLKYFDDAVRERWEDVRLALGTAGFGGGARAAADAAWFKRNGYA